MFGVLDSRWVITDHVIYSGYEFRCARNLGF
jgi:hypothetical protein